MVENSAGDQAGSDVLRVLEGEYRTGRLRLGGRFGAQQAPGPGRPPGSGEPANADPGATGHGQDEDGVQHRPSRGDAP